MRIICDESGAKGSATNSESFPGETGVFTGILVQDSARSAFESDLRAMYLRYFALAALGQTASGKLHVTDLLPPDQDRLRSDVWSLMRQHQTRWIYEAIYVEGFHAWHMQLVQGLEELRKSLTSPIRTSANPPLAPSMHSELFTGLCATAFGVLLDEIGAGPVELDIVLDHVDASVEMEFRAAVQEFIAPLGGTTEVRGWDLATKSRVSGTITVTASITDPDLQASSYRLAVLAAGAPEALAADVLANSLDYHLRQLQKVEVGRPLQSRDALKGFPVEDLATGFDDTVHMSDALYAHPRRKVDGANL
jgi:hypothetical protein